MILTILISLAMHCFFQEPAKKASITIDGLKLEMSANNSDSFTDIGLIFTIRNNDSVGYYIDELLPLFNHLEIEMIDGKKTISVQVEWATDESCFTSQFIFNFNQNSSLLGSQIVDVFELKSVKDQYHIPEEGLGFYNELDAKKRKNESICYLSPGEIYSRFFCFNYFLEKGLKYRVRLNYPSKFGPDIYYKLMDSIEEMPSHIEEYTRCDQKIKSEWVEFGPYN